MEDPCWCRLQDLEIAVALAPTHKNGWANDGVPKLLDGTNMGLLGLNVALVPKNATPNAVHASAPSCGLFATHPSQVINGHPQPEDTTRERDMRKWFEENQASLKKSGKRRHEEPLSSGETELSMERPECWMQETEPIEGLADRITLDHCPRGGYVDPAQPWNLADRQGPVRFSVSVNAILKSLEGLREGACVDIGLANMGISDIAPALLFVFGTFGVRSHTHAAFTSAQEEQFKCFMRHIFGQLEDGFDFARRGSAAMKHFQQGLTDAPAWGRPPNCPQPDRWDPEKGQGYFSLVALNLLYCSLGNVTRRNGELMLDLRTKTDWSIYFYMSPTALSPRFHRSTLFDILFSVVAMNPATIHNGYINTNLITPFDNQQSFAPFLRSPMSTNDKKRPYFMFLYMQRQVYGGPPPTAGSSIIYSFVIQPNANATDPPLLQHHHCARAGARSCRSRIRCLPPLSPPHGQTAASMALLHVGRDDPRMGRGGAHSLLGPFHHCRAQSLQSIPKVLHQETNFPRRTSRRYLVRRHARHSQLGLSRVAPEISEGRRGLVPNAVTARHAQHGAPPQRSRAWADACISTRLQASPRVASDCADGKGCPHRP
jgi:hypothetical protein